MLNRHTRAVEGLGQFSDHDLDNKTNADAEHFTKKFWLGADTHSQEHHYLLPVTHDIKYKHTEQ